MSPESPEQRCADLIGVRNPGWEIIHVPEEQVYRAWRIENGRPIPPTFSDDEPSRLEAQLRRSVDAVLTERLRDAIHEMRDRGLLPDWRPGPNAW